ncbi:MAG: phospho-N-acetylmuramoyl-pentapeptide-transferase [Oscillospiraceae bacterium]|nr:phospho-N-acetylmuramoyl-pentapeptide-transferase [Oscillospiraceae bacterium]
MADIIPGGIRTAAFLITLIGTLALGFIAIPLLRRFNIGQTVRDDGPATHLAKTGTPTMGGIIFIVPAAVVLAVLSARDHRIIPQLLLTLGFGLVGFADDFIKVIRKNKNGLTPMQKTAGIVFCAAIFSIYAAFSANIGTTILLPLTGFTGGWVMPVWLYIPFTVFVLYGTSNALNFTDGVDGLASSVTVLVMASFTVAAAVNVRNDGAAALTAAFAGGCLGFLFFNAHPARVMMGDCGSLALGGAVAAAAVVMQIHWILLFFGAIYVAEGLSVIIQVSYFKRTRRRVFKMAPIHHHFELSGWGEGRIVFVFCCVTFVFCCAGLWLLFGRIF